MTDSLKSLDKNLKLVERTNNYEESLLVIQTIN
jgi:hypothetical protein